MGIKGLSQLLIDYAPNSVIEKEIKNYFGRKIAIDASTSIYQFLVAVRSEGNNLQNEEGETTSHLMGMFYRTVRMCENGIKPCYVFDGKPPELKSCELERRTERRVETQKSLLEAYESGTPQDVAKFTRRMVKATKKHNEDCKKLLMLMGIPYIEAPCEAEAQCAELVKLGKVFATGTEDLDALTFGTPILLRRITFSDARKLPIQEINLNVALEELNISMDQFIDLCILLGCDYCETIGKVGPQRALSLIREHKDIETILKHLDLKKHPVVENWKYKEARDFFKNPEVRSCDDVKLVWQLPDIEGLVQFMCEENGFSHERIRNGAAKLVKSATAAVQGRIDSFFSVTASKRPAAVVKKSKNKNKKVNIAGRGRKKS
ncbi:flap endonuclease 1-like [Zophobas morio]|uniref:flap endonuclease 1-like n=1 Tax=Zophobas morio TaxID=2755281 RepID=UPI003083C9F0